MQNDSGIAGLFAIFGIGTLLAVLVVWAACMYFSSDIASKKGMSYFVWGIIGMCLGPLAILILMAYPVNQNALDRRSVRRKRKQSCPFCQKAISIDAICCLYCGSTVNPQKKAELSNSLSGYDY